MLPTIQALTGDVTSTEYTKLSPVPPLGLGATFQALPFQCSARVRRLPVPLMYQPTAQALVAEVAATACRVLATVPALGLGTTFQIAPFQCSIRVRVVPPLTL